MEESVKFDYTVVLELIAKLEQDFNKILAVYEIVMQINDAIVSQGVWDSPSRDYYNEMLEDVINNYLKLCDLKNNIIGYLNMVYSNYNALEHSANALFSNFAVGNLWG